MLAPRSGPPPQVSVAISTWNRAHLLGRAIRSALAQSFKDFELLVVDDGSTDGTPEVLAGAADPRLIPVRHERNYGIARTRNTALGLARGEWVAFHDDDNEWAPDYLEQQVAFAASQPGAGVVYCRARMCDAKSGDDSGVFPRELRQGKVFEALVGGWIPFVSSALIRRSLLLEIGGLDERLRANEDRDLLMRLAQHTEFAGTSDALLIHHFNHGPQLSYHPEFQAQDAAFLARKWRTAVTATCGRKAYRHWRLSLVLWAERCRMARMAEQGGRERVVLACSAGRLLRLFPESAPHVAEALKFVIFGRRWPESSIRRLSRYVWRCWRSRPHT